MSCRRFIRLSVYPSVRLLLVPCVFSSIAASQQPRSEQRCLIELERPLLREGTRVEVAPGFVNFFGGGDARFRCRNMQIRMRSDSVAIYQGDIAQFIGQVRYQDSTVIMTSDFGTYTRNGEKWEARGNVVLQNIKDGTVLRGPMLDYWRQIPGFRDSAEMYAAERPTVTLPVKDTAETDPEPYVVVGDWIRTMGSNRLIARGRVTIDRSDFRGRADSLHLDTGPANLGSLVGSASLKRVAEDSFDLNGKRIDLKLDQKELTYVTALDSAKLRSADMSLDGDTIGLDVNNRKVEQTLAWGSSIRPLALSSGYEVRGDSMAFDTPEQALKEIRAFGSAWVGAVPDSGTSDRDWIAGDTVRAEFVKRDSAGSDQTSVKLIEARGTASALYRLRQAGQTQASITYNKGDLIRIRMRLTGDSTQVDSVEVIGNVEGIHLQPAPPRRDTARTDTTASSDGRMVRWADDTSRRPAPTVPGVPRGRHPTYPTHPSSPTWQPRKGRA